MLLEKVFRRTLAMYPHEGLDSWDWGAGVAIYGLQATYPKVAPALQEDFRKFLVQWFRVHLDKSPPTKDLNGAICLTVLWRALQDKTLPFTGEERTVYRQFCQEHINFYRRNAERVEQNGVFAHSVRGIPESSKQVWADNLMMLLLLLANYAASESDERLIDEVINQVALHYVKLTDTATNLLYHGWQADATPPSLNGALWGRGNGWAAVGIIELMDVVLNSRFKLLIGEFSYPSLDQFFALLNYQREDGRWNTLLDKSWSYPETSVTAALAYAFLKGVRLQALDPEFEEAGQKALAALQTQIAPGGEILGVSGATPLLPTLQAYNDVPSGKLTPWGQGLALLALAEANK